MQEAALHSIAPANPALVYSRRPSGRENLNPQGLSLKALLHEDFVTHERNLFEQGLWAIATHRFGNWRLDLPRIFRAPCALLYHFMYKVVEWTCGISLPQTVKVGRRVRIWHHSGMILNAESIGDDCHIRQNTTFGVLRTNHYQVPIIEDRVDMGCGVAILGAIRIGHDSVIGANSMVNRDVPPYSVVGGVPARVLKMRNAEKNY
ncbi:MAG TPA: hypothetical protein VGG19_12865 [Tepidisphaeraceae bacterium]|jgi:serine O-acetyltransferase